LAADGWEANEARGNAGLFQPIGFPAAGEAPQSPVVMKVTATELFLRSMPSTKGNTPLLRLHQGQVIEVLGAALPPFMRVRVQVPGQPIEGYASGRFLAPADAGTAVSAGPPIAPTSAFAPPPVHFQPGDSRSRRGSTSARAQPLGETPSPERTVVGTPGQRAAALNDIVDWLDVESSARYQPAPDKTFCNVYAADFCFLAGVYLPRTWWMASALAAMAAGSGTPMPVYAQNIRELRADDLLAWLQEFGAAFGWRQVFDMTTLQDGVNRGNVGLICADRATEGRPGHIVAVVPETPQTQAARDADGRVQRPVQSQAGASNHARIVHASRWWDDQIKFRDRGFFMHD
jgi:hypothetical protein